MVASHSHRRGGGGGFTPPMRLSLATLFTMFSIFCNIFLFVIVFMKMTDTKQCIQQDITQIKCPPCAPCVCDNDDSARVLTLRNAAASPFKQLATQLATQAYMQQDSDEDDEKPHAMYFPEDLTEKANFDPATHEVTWKVCVLKTDSKGKEYISPSEYLCENNPRNEQSYQLQWYGSHVRKKTSSSLHPPFVKCVQLPPEDYKFPPKYPVIPAMSDAVHWPNLRVVNRTELIVFNKNTPKNLYHFNAPAYDAEALNDLKIAARYIPFGKKVRTMLDVGAGGGSMGVLVRRKYDVQTVSTIFADWPYCEYITERGNPCLLSDSMESLPFAKFSFDLVHISWVYHGQQPEDVVKFLREANRVTRPGGYIWLYDGWSKSQVDAIELTAKKFGWHLLHEYRREIEKEVSRRISFGKNLPYEWEWRTIFVKPIRYVKVSGSECDWTAGLTYNVTEPYDEEDEPFPPLPGQVVEKKAKPTLKPKRVKEEKESEEDETPDKAAAAPATSKKAASKKPAKPAIPAAPAQPAAPAAAAAASGEEEEGEEEEEKPAAPVIPAAPAAPAGKKATKSKKAAPIVVTPPPAPPAAAEEEEEEEEEAPTTPPPAPKKKKKSKKVRPAAADPGAAAAAVPAAAADPAQVVQQSSEQAAAVADAPAAAAQAAAPAAPVKKKKKKIKGIPDGPIPPAPGQLAAQQAADANQAEPAADESNFGVAGAGPPARPYQPGDQ